VYTTEKGLYLATVASHQVDRLMRAAHARAMAIALKSQGVAPARADSIVALYKKRRRRKNSNRSIGIARPSKSARSALAKQIKELFDKERPKLAHQISTLIRRTGKSDDDRVEQIMGELDFDGWVTLVVDGQKILVHIVVDGSAKPSSRSARTHAGDARPGERSRDRLGERARGRAGRNEIRGRWHAD
jgi:hypothetical protein